MLRNWLSKGIGVLLILVFVVGCSTTMNVNVFDPTGRPIDGATVSVDGGPIGQTPDASTRVSNFVGNTPSIRVTADGYLPRTVDAEKEFKVGAFIGGIFVWPVLLWVWGPRAQQNIILTPAQ